MEVGSLFSLFSSPNSISGLKLAYCALNVRAAVTWPWLPSKTLSICWWLVFLGKKARKIHSAQLSISHPDPLQDIHSLPAYSDFFHILPPPSLLSKLWIFFLKKKWPLSKIQLLLVPSVENWKTVVKNQATTRRKETVLWILNVYPILSLDVTDRSRRRPFQRQVHCMHQLPLL